VLGAGMKSLVDLYRAGIPDGQGDAFLVGVVTAAAVGYAAIAGLMRFLQQRSTDVFVIYRLGLGITLLLLIAAGFRA
jgi:undecaprenyl-diphosphatase